MRRNAYVLLADPAFLQASLSSYYDHVDRIVLSYDETSTSWTGTEIPVEECIRLAEEIDVDGKCVHVRGHYAQLDRHPMDNDTAQRQAALAVASEGADWVIQLDTDEVMADPETFFRCLDRADATGTDALEYPARWLYARVKQNRYLESSSRFWRDRASFPGPVAVRAGTKLLHSRQTNTPTYRVDFAHRNTDPDRPSTAIVHDVIEVDSGIVHFSWVRDDETMRLKFGWSGHTEEYSRPKVYRAWAMRQRHPWMAALTTPLRSRNGWFRLATVTEPTRTTT